MFLLAQLDYKTKIITFEILKEKISMLESIELEAIYQAKFL